MEKNVETTGRQKYQLEFEIRSSPKILFNFLSSPSGLAEWFADDVRIRDGIYTFVWDKSEQKAKIASKKDNVFIKFKWLDSEEYFQFDIVQDEITNDVALMVTDFGDQDALKENHLLWDAQIHNLRQIVGS